MTRSQSPCDLFHNSGAKPDHRRGKSSGNPASNSSLARTPLKQRCRFDEFERWPHMYGDEFRLPSFIHQCWTAAVNLLKDCSA